MRHTRQAGGAPAETAAQEESGGRFRTRVGAAAGSAALPAALTLAFVLTAAASHELVPHAWLVDGVALVPAVGLLWAFWAQRRELIRRRAAERSLARSEERYRLIFEHAPVGVAQIDADGRCVDANEPLAAILGAPREELIGFDVRSALRDPVMRAAFDAGLAGEHGRFDGPYRSATAGRKRHVRVRFERLPDPGGTAHGMVCLFDDMTDRYEAEERARQLQHLEGLATLAGGVAHDFNNVLVGVLGNAELLAETLPPDSPSRQDVAEIIHAATRAADLADRMLACAGSAPFADDALDVGDLARQSVDLLRPTLPAGVTLRARVNGDLPMAHGEARRLRRALESLIENAVEARGSRGGRIDVAVDRVDLDDAALAKAIVPAASGPGSYLSISVRDDGLGMEEEVLARAFDPFFSTRFPGRGLGLPTVLGTMRGHGGTVRVSSAPGGGSTFELLLPLPAAALAAGQNAPAGGPAHAPLGATVGARGRGLALVVDDEETVRSVAARMLARIGFDVVEAADGESAVAHLREDADRVAFVLLDLTMPGLDGVDTLRALRALSPDLPVILATGYREVEARARFDGRAHRPDRIVRKPFQFDDLSYAADFVLRSRGPGATTEGTPPGPAPVPD